jgi:hypothetical protein
VVLFLLVLPFWAASGVMAWLLAVKADDLRLSLPVVIVLLFVLAMTRSVAASAVSPRIRPGIPCWFASVSWPIRSILPWVLCPGLAVRVPVFLNIPSALIRV